MIKLCLFNYHSTNLKIRLCLSKSMNNLFLVCVYDEGSLFGDDLKGCLFMSYYQYLIWSPIV